MKTFKKDKQRHIYTKLNGTGVHKAGQGRKKGTAEEYYTRFKVYVDLDDTLVDLSTPMLQEFEVSSQEELKIKYSRDDINEWFNSKDIQFWANLEWKQNGKRLWFFLQRFRPYIISVHNNYPGAMIGKTLWMCRNIVDGDIVANKTILLDKPEKEKYASKNSVLIDDYKPFCDSWINAGGLAVLYDDNDYKKSIRSIKNILVKNRSDRSELT